MIAPVCRLVDWMAIELAAARMARPDGNEPRLEEMEQLLESRDFIPVATEAARVQLAGPLRIRFETPRPGAIPENNTVHGRLYRCGERWQEHPTVLLMHGWNDATNHYFRFPRMAGQFNRNGFNAATLEAPFHFQRRPRRLGAWGNFLCPDVLRTVQAAAQAVAETRAFAGWLLGQGCPAVGLLGISLGGWLAGLTLCHDARLACAVLTVPVARMDRLVEEAGFCRNIRRALQGRRADLSRLNLTANRPAIPRERILLIEAVHDLFVPKETTEELWQAWGQPDIWRLRHGHISVLAAPGLAGRIIGWMGPRLRAKK
jgi:dienelactone hydrolase